MIVNRIGVALAILMAVGPAAQPLFAQGRPAWQDALARDIQSAKGCEVDFLSHVIERRVDGLPFIMAKVHCRDQRAFDATRRGDTAVFEYRECEKRDEASC